MKTAREWASVIGNGNEIDWCGSWVAFIQEVESTIKAIQLDTMKEGARKATEIMGEQPFIGDSGYEAYLSLTEAVLTTSEKWTEKDL